MYKQQSLCSPRTKLQKKFCIANDFCKVFDAQIEKYIVKSSSKRKYHRYFIMSKDEMIVIIILFNSYSYRCQKHFLCAVTYVICFQDCVIQPFCGVAERFITKHLSLNTT